MGNLVMTVSGKGPMPAGAKPLGKAKDLAWAALPWSDSGAIPAQAKLSYLDEAAYQTGTQGLKKGDLAAVMAKRAGSQSEVLSDAAEDLAIELGCSGNAESFLSGYSLGRSFSDKADGLTRAYALRDDLDSLEKEGGGAPDSFSAPTRQAIAKAAAALGQPSLLQGPLHSNRAVVAYLDQPGLLQKRVDHREIPFEKIGSGYLIALSPKDLATQRALGKVVLVYPSTAAYARSTNLETQAQRLRTLMAARKRGGPAPEDYRTEILRTRAELMASLHAFLIADKALPAPERKALEAAQSAETGLLRFGGSTPPGLAERLAALAAFSARAGEKPIADWAARSASSLAGKP
jgi:hypothetical protein